MQVVKVREALEHPFKNSGLSPGEIEVLEWALQGKTNQIIAIETNKSLTTMATLLFRGLHKLGISKAELGYWVIQRAKEALG